MNSFLLLLDRIPTALERVVVVGDISKIERYQNQNENGYDEKLGEENWLETVQQPGSFFAFLSFFVGHLRCSNPSRRSNPQ